MTTSDRQLMSRIQRRDAGAFEEFFACTVGARAAARGEIDPLTEIDSRLFVGLPPVETA